MASSNSTSLVDNIIETQKKVLDSVTENTKKIAGDNTILNETIEKGSDWYKNWLESQKNMFTKATGFATHTAENGSAKHENATAKEAVAGANEFLENWVNAQSAWAKQIWEMSQEAAKKFGTGTTNPFANFNTANPFANFTNHTTNPFANWQNSFNGNANPWATWMNQANTHNWMNQVQQANPFTQDSFKKVTDNLTETFNKYYATLNNNFTEWQNSFKNGTVQDAYKSMINSGEGFTKFTEMWMPMIKSIQDKTFNMDEYKKLMNPELYKEFIDKFLGLLPEGSREQMDKMTAMMNNGLKQMSEAGMTQYHQMRDAMSKMNNGSEMFGEMHNAFSKWQNQMSEAAAPFTKLITPNDQTKTAQAWSDISNRIMVYNLKNAELQYMMYTQGAKVMDKLAESVAQKVKDGVEVTSITALYQEWLNISDKVYVSLFESNEYSTLMAEVGSMQMKLRKDIDLQNEKLLKDIPVATRSEMDEVYKIIYDLKKKVRQLEKMLELDETEEETVATEEGTKDHHTESAKTAAPKRGGKK